jgi:hypothetical protein
MLDKLLDLKPTFCAFYLVDFVAIFIREFISGTHRRARIFTQNTPITVKWVGESWSQLHIGSQTTTRFYPVRISQNSLDFNPVCLRHLAGIPGSWT